MSECAATASCVVPWGLPQSAVAAVAVGGSRMDGAPELVAALADADARFNGLGRAFVEYLCKTLRR
jgi:hypothetical protein